MGKTAFIGSGSMARAIIGGLVRHGVPGGDILVVNPRNPKSTGEVQAMYGAVPSAPEAIREADTVVVAVKPQSFPEAAPVYRDFIAPGTLVVTIMAGIGTETVEAAFPQARVVRVMPNIAMSVGCGASGVAPGKTATDADVEKVVGIFACGGVAVKIDESEIDDVAALSGSGAAYVYLLIEALRDAAIEDGIADEVEARFGITVGVSVIAVCESDVYSVDSVLLSLPAEADEAAVCDYVRYISGCGRVEVTR